MNLVDTVKEEATAGHLTDGELWLFTDNSTAESCFSQGGSSSRLLHDLGDGLWVHLTRGARRRVKNDSSRNGWPLPEVLSWKGSCREMICSLL